jgi:hypothetical protein
MKKKTPKKKKSVFLPVFSFFLYGLKKSFWIKRIICRNASCVNMLGELNKNKTAICEASLLLSTVSQKKVAFISLFFTNFFPSLYNRRCLFQSLLILLWVKKYNLHPKLNIGISHGSKEADGHSWLSINGHEFCERTALPAAYPIRMAEKGQIMYWYGEQNKYKVVSKKG